jgi:hypothetical protein
MRHTYTNPVSTLFLSLSPLHPWGGHRAINGRRRVDALALRSRLL